MSDDFVQDAMDKLLVAGEVALNIARIDVLADLQNAVAVPVEEIGGRIIRSVPGEPPRRETGALLDGLDAVVSESGPDEITLEVTSSVPYSARLEKTRPFMGPAFERMERTLPDRVAEVMARVLR